VRHYWGVDFSQECIDFARANQKRLGIRNATFEAGDVARFCTLRSGLPESDRFDVVFTFAFSGYLDDAEFQRIYSAIRASMKPRGKLYLYIANRDFFLERLKHRGFVIAARRLLSAPAHRRRDPRGAVAGRIRLGRDPAPAALQRPAPPPPALPHPLRRQVLPGPTSSSPRPLNLEKSAKNFARNFVRPLLPQAAYARLVYLWHALVDRGRADAGEWPALLADPRLDPVLRDMLLAANELHGAAGASNYWAALNLKNTRQYIEHGFADFKQTVALDYFTFFGKNNYQVAF
jgi:SAM-dependent methyltransferase